MLSPAYATLNHGFDGPTQDRVLVRVTDTRVLAGAILDEAALTPRGSCWAAL